MKKPLFTERKYHMLDFLRIPFAVAPLCTFIKVSNQMLSSLVPAIQVYITAWFIDTATAIFNKTAAGQSIYLPLFVLLLVLSYSPLNALLMKYVILKFDMRLEAACRDAMLEKRAKLHYRHIENNDTWDLIKRTCDDPMGRIMMGYNSLMTLLDVCVRVTSTLLVLLTQIWWLGIIFAVLIVPLAYIGKMAGNDTYKAFKEAQKHTRRANYFLSVLQSRDFVEERTLYGYTDNVNEKWYEKFEIARKINLKVIVRYTLLFRASSLASIACFFAVMTTMLHPLKAGIITIGVFLGISDNVYGLFNRMSWHTSYAIQLTVEALEYLKDLTAFWALDETPEAVEPPSEKRIEFESVEFKNVYFKYPDTEKYILKGLDLKLNKNRHYAIVGINGAGKTTITKLLTGLYDNYDGEILLNGKSLRLYSQPQLKSLFSIVYQDFARYAVKLSDNIKLGDVNATDESKLNQIVDMLGLCEVVEQLPQGMDTYLGKIKTNSVDLSGGEWQRVAIARALYNPAEIRILDEPTAALDPVAESKVYEMFGEISRGKSTVFITHRLGAARLADEIVVLDDGKVAEIGSHDQLVGQNGIYAEMFEAQRSWYQ